MPPKQKKEQTVEKMNEIFNQEKIKHTPSLYTKLNIAREGALFEISAHEIISLAKDVSLEFLNSISIEKRNGSIDDPYILENPASWFQTAADFKVSQESKEKKYFLINKQLFSVREDDRYMTFHSESKNEDFSAFLHEIAPILLKENLASAGEFLADFDDSNPTEILKNLPIALDMIQSMDARYQKPTEKEEQCLTYPQAAKEHKATQNIFASQLSQWNQQNTSISSGVSVSNLSDEINRILNDFEKTIEQADMLSESQKQNAIELLSNIRTTTNNMDIATFQQNPTPQALLEQIKNQSPEDFNSLSALLGASPDANSIFSLLIEKNQPTTLDCEKANSLNDINSSQEIRDILSSKAVRPKRHLYPIIAPLFFSETSRYLPCFIASIALLDLIKMQRETPDSNEKYSLQNLLENPKERNLFCDAHGVYYSRTSEKKFIEDRKKFTRALQGAGLTESAAQEKASLIYKNPKSRKSPIDEVICGYHPMVQGASFYDIVPEENRYKTGRDNLVNFVSNAALTLVEQKVANILLEWLYIQLHAEGYSVELRKEILPENLSAGKDDILLQSRIKFLLMQRIKTFDFIEPSKKTPVKDNLSVTLFGNKEMNIHLKKTARFAVFEKLTPLDSELQASNKFGCST